MTDRLPSLPTDTSLKKQTGPHFGPFGVILDSPIRPLAVIRSAPDASSTSTVTDTRWLGGSDEVGTETRASIPEGMAVTATVRHGPSPQTVIALTRWPRMIEGVVIETPEEHPTAVQD